MGLFDLFTPSQPAAPAPVDPTANQPAPAGNIQDPAAIAAGSTDAGAMPPSPMQDPNVPVSQDASLDQFATLWEDVPNSETGVATPAPLDQAAIQRAVAKTNFSDAIDPVMLDAVTQGGEGAQAALANIMNAVAQKVMVQSTLVNNKLNERSLATARTAFEAGIPGMLRKQGAANHLKETAPLASNPAIAPVAQAAQQQLLQKFPNASQAEITTMTNDYLVAMSAAFAPAPVADPSAPVEVDWSTFLQ